jgi:hypothetical protein
MTKSDRASDEAKSEQWQTSFGVAWERLFDALPSAERFAVIESPTGSTAAELVRQASNAADLDAAKR